MKQREIRQANPRDSGELLRNLDGVSAVRRGPVGLDPVVRGLRETEVGTYLDGTRIFPGGAARMDSPLSHLDPTMIETIEVVKGPYALTWGAGNLSAIRAQTQQLKTLTESFGGQVSSGYDSNFNSFEESLSLHGNTGTFGYQLSGAWRTGNDYHSGNGTQVPGNYLSREIRGKVGYALTDHSWLNLALGYQNQQDLDYPGRLLDADFFNTYNLAANWEWNPQNSIIKSLEAKAYINNVDHGMDNDGKPTAQPDSNRMPPFGLDVHVNSKAHVTGGRLAAELATSDSWTWEIGADIYSAWRDATRTIKRRDNGMLLFADLMWPKATITDAGLFTRAIHSFSDQLSTTGTLRLDLVSAKADTISQFFKDNVTTDLDATEINLSASATASYTLTDNWTLGVGMGSVVRTADASERYSDRIPASKAQTSAEFMGNPNLKPERSTQADLWMDAAYDSWNLSVNTFFRQIDNYITLQPTNLPRRLPLSPETVYQYINGSARFWGFEVSGGYRIIPELRFTAVANYLWGQDTELDESVLGVAPFGVDTDLRYESGRWPLFIEGIVHFVGEQDRASTTRGETPTDGYMTADIQAGGTIWNKVSIQLGIKNITDKHYVDHLNAKNPFTGHQIPEPGRIIFADVSVRF
jgi:iron complex outermembrane receptor protein